MVDRTEEERLAATAKSLGAVDFHPWAEGSQYPGINLRQHFAGLALQGLCAAITNYDGPSRVIDTCGIARDAVAFADSLLKELSK